MSDVPFAPWHSLLPGNSSADCLASVIIPARNEETLLPRALDAFATQVGTDGHALPPGSFEIIILLNNCTDSSAAAVALWKRCHPTLHVHSIERTLPSQIAHAGTARRMLMDTAWHRLGNTGQGTRAILSTDADTVVARDWIVRNLCALGRGADAVGGAIYLRQSDLEQLPAGAHQAYLRDRRYQSLVAEFESLLDPQAGDPWPRHLEHFGASLACTPAMYARAGGMPAVKLEDVAFVDALRQVDVRLRHDPTVVVYTSSRLEGRAEVGLSHQLRLWQQMHQAGEEQVVPSASWLRHRFMTMRQLRRICAQDHPAKVKGCSSAWRKRIAEAHWPGLSIGQFLREIDCDRLIKQTFNGGREEPIGRATRRLASAILQVRNATSPSPSHAGLINPIADASAESMQAG